MSGRLRRAAMAPLREPATFCIRSFEANPHLVPLLRAGAAPPDSTDGATTEVPPNVRYIAAALSNRTGKQLARTVVKYAQNPWGSTASTLKFEDIHPGKPSILSTETVRRAALPAGCTLSRTDPQRRVGGEGIGMIYIRQFA